MWRMKNTYYLEDKITSVVIVTQKNDEGCIIGYVITILFAEGYERYNIRMTSSNKFQAYRYIEQYAISGKHRVSINQYYRPRKHKRQYVSV